MFPRPGVSGDMPCPPGLGHQAGDFEEDEMGCCPVCENDMDKCDCIEEDKGGE